MKFHHVGYIVENISQAILEWGEFGFKLKSEIFSIHDQQVDVCFLTNFGD